MTAMPEAAPPASPVLQRITTAYDPEQDRMRLDGERADGSTLTLWLTQRLLKHLEMVQGGSGDKQGIQRVGKKFTERRATCDPFRLLLGMNIKT